MFQLLSMVLWRENEIKRGGLTNSSLIEEKVNKILFEKSCLTTAIRKQETFRLAAIDQARFIELE